MSDRDDRDHDEGQEIADRETRHTAVRLANGWVNVDRRSPLVTTADPVELLDNIVRDYARQMCDHVEDCDCSAAQAWRFMQANCLKCHGRRKVWQPIRNGGAVQVPCDRCT